MPSDSAAAEEDGGPLYRLLRRAIDLCPGEAQALAWAWLYVFALFLAYYVLRPIRDELGVAGGVRNLPWLFTGTLLVMLAANPLFSWAVGRWPRERFIPLVYRFFALNLLVFMALLAGADAGVRVWVGRAFFIWVSVFNLFVVSVFWSVVVDVFDAEQGKRLFGTLAAGATVGGIAGSAFTAGLVGLIGQDLLPVASIALLEVAVLAVRRLSGFGMGGRGRRKVAERVIGGGVLAGITHTLRSPYLLGIAAFILLYSVTSTILYFQQAGLAAAHFTDRAARTAFFAGIDLWVNGLTIACQLFLTGRLAGRLGVAATLAVLPALSALGFAALVTAPTLAVFVVVQVGRRVSNFALARPMREVLFTAVPREDRYKAKNFIDTVVYRGGDQVGAWGYGGLAALGLGIGGTALVAIPLCLAWLAVSLWLGWRQQMAVRGASLPSH